MTERHLKFQTCVFTIVTCVITRLPTYRGIKMIDAIAVDMDGTFLNEHGTYDHGWFQTILPQLEDAGIQFVVASGNPHYQLRQQFAEVAHRIMMVAENGGEILINGQ